MVIFCSSWGICISYDQLGGGNAPICRLWQRGSRRAFRSGSAGPVWCIVNGGRKHGNNQTTWPTTGSQHGHQHGRPRGARSKDHPDRLSHPCARSKLSATGLGLQGPLWSLHVSSKAPTATKYFEYSSCKVASFCAAQSASNAPIGMLLPCTRALLSRIL